MSSVCFDIKSFCESIRWSALPPGSTETERMFLATLKGFVERHISIFGALVILERAGKIEEAFILGRTLFELSVDAALFWNSIVNSDNADEIMGRISYEWDTNKFRYLKDHPDLSDEKLEVLQSKVKKIPGLSDKDHKAIIQKQHFSGATLRDRCNEVDVGKYYKPVFSRLSRYTHGMTFDREMILARNLSFPAYQRERTVEECLTLTHSAMLALEAIKMLSPVTGLIYDEKTWSALLDRTTSIVDKIPEQIGDNSKAI